jgi:hypothetical protein
MKGGAEKRKEEEGSDGREERGIDAILLPLFSHHMLFLL